MGNVHHENLEAAIRETLARKGLTQAGVADALGVRPQAVGQVINFQSTGLPKALLRVLDYLELEVTAIPKTSRDDGHPGKGAVAMRDQT